MLLLPPLSRLLALTLCVVAMVVVRLLFMLVVLMVLRVMLLRPLGRSLRLGVGLGFGDRVKVVEDVVLELRGDPPGLGRVGRLLFFCFATHGKCPKVRV